MNIPIKLRSNSVININPFLLLSGYKRTAITEMDPIKAIQCM